MTIIHGVALFCASGILLVWIVYPARIQTVVCVVLSSNLRLADAPGNVVIAKRDSGLPKDSVANVSQIVTVDRDVLTERAGKLTALARERIDRGLRPVLGL